YDEAEIETTYPLLTWFHNEPFDILSEGEFYRIVVCEMKNDESASAAINNNTPVFIKDYLNSHQVPYASDGGPLRQGIKYAWEVQKISKNAIVQKTETWWFKLKPKESVNDIKYM